MKNSNQNQEDGKHVVPKEVKGDSEAKEKQQEGGKEKIAVVQIAVNLARVIVEIIKIYLRQKGDGENE